jgi:hypothetical protein
LTKLGNLALVDTTVVKAAGLYCGCLTGYSRNTLELGEQDNAESGYFLTSTATIGFVRRAVINGVIINIIIYYNIYYYCYVTLLSLTYSTLLVCAFPLGLSGTSLPLLFTVTLRPVPLQDVFLLPVQSVGTKTYLTETAF